MDRFILLLVVVGVFLVLVRRFGNSSADFEIRVKSEGNLEILGRFPRSKVAEIRRFFIDEPQELPGSRIRGWFGPTGVPRIVFDGRFSEGRKQQIRNFLINHLQ